MNMEDNWSRIRTATKKFIVHDLPDVARVGLVLFNEAAHEGYPVSELRPESREGMAYSIGNKYDLSPSRSSCVRCGIEQAVLSLQESGVTAQGAVLIIISQGSISSFSLGDEKDMLDVARRHSLQIYSISLPQLPIVDVNLSLERLAHYTGGESFYLSGEESTDSSLATYVKLMDTFREIQARTWTSAPQLIHEAKFSGHSEGVYENRGHFTIDKYTGTNTQFMVIAQNPSENYLKSISLQDQRGNMYSKIMDNMANFHIFSVYKVPFESDQNIGMNWSYSLERLPSSDLSNTHFVEVISHPRDTLDTINIRIWSNLEEHAVRLTGSTPVILYAEISVGRAPVLDASVTAEIQAINQSGYLSPKSYTTLLDNGNGDPDLVRQDGVYSRYLTGLPVEGRYTVRLIVTDNHGKAFAPLKVYGEPTRSCCLDVPAKISNQKLGSFTRMKLGDSFRVHNVVQDGEYPPARILDLSVSALAKSEELEFKWTSPGEDLDIGKPTSYQLFFAKNPQAFYSGKNRVEVLESFSASKVAGGKEVRRSRIPALDKTIYYAILAVDQHGHLGEMSNIVKSLVQGRLASRNDLKTGARQSAAVSTFADDTSFINGGTLLDVEKPSTILFYLIAGIVGFIIICGFIIMIIMLSFRHRRKKEPTSIDEEDLQSTGSGGGFTSLEAPLQGTSTLEIAAMDPETKHFLLGNSAQDSLLVGPTHSSLIKDDSSGGESVMENPYGYSAGGAGFQNFQNSQMAVSAANSFGWSATNNPYVYKDQNETYATIGSLNNTSQDSYIRGVQPTYARAIPKNLRSTVQGQHIYSNAAMIAARSSPHGSHLMATSNMMAARSSPNGSQNSIASSRGTVTFQTQAETSLASPDPDSSDQAPTPTKSILKKPRHHHQTPRDNLTDTMSDRDSQCSQQSHSSSRNLYPSNL